MARVSPRTRTAPTGRASGRSGTAPPRGGRGRADAAPAPAGLGGCVRARGRHRPAQGSGSARSPPGERIDPGRLSLCRSPFLPYRCPSVALLLPDRGRAGFGRWTCILSARPGGWGGGAGRDRCLTALPAAEACRGVRQHPELADTGAQAAGGGGRRAGCDEAALLTDVLSVVKFRLREDRQSREHVLRALLPAERLLTLSPAV